MVKSQPCTAQQYCSLNGGYNRTLNVECKLFQALCLWPLPWKDECILQLLDNKNSILSKHSHLVSQIMTTDCFSDRHTRGNTGRKDIFISNRFISWCDVVHLLGGFYIRLWIKKTRRLSISWMYFTLCIFFLCIYPQTSMVKSKNAFKWRSGVQLLDLYYQFMVIFYSLHTCSTKRHIVLLSCVWRSCVAVSLHLTCCSLSSYHS